MTHLRDGLALLLSDIIMLISNIHVDVNINVIIGIGIFSMVISFWRSIIFGIIFGA